MALPLCNLNLCITPFTEMTAVLHDSGFIDVIAKCGEIVRIHAKVSNITYNLVTQHFDFPYKFVMQLYNTTRVCVLPPP